MHHPLRVHYMRPKRGEIACSCLVTKSMESFFSETESRCRGKVLAMYGINPYSIARGLNQTLYWQKMTRIGKLNSANDRQTCCVADIRDSKSCHNRTNSPVTPSLFLRKCSTFPEVHKPNRSLK